MQEILHMYLIDYDDCYYTHEPVTDVKDYLAYLDNVVLNNNQRSKVKLRTAADLLTEHRDSIFVTALDKAFQSLDQTFLKSVGSKRNREGETNNADRKCASRPQKKKK